MYVRREACELYAYHNVKIDWQSAGDPVPLRSTKTRLLCPLALSYRVCGVRIHQESEKGSRNAAQPLLAVGRSPERFFAPVHREEPRTLMGVRPGPRGHGSRAGLPAYSRHGA